MNATLATYLTGLMKAHGKSPGEVMYVGSRDGAFSLSWSAFVRGPGNTRRYADRRFKRVAHDLVVVGDGWWLQRIPRTLSSFVFCTPPVYAPNAQPFKRIQGYTIALETQQKERHMSAKALRARRRRRWRRVRLRWRRVRLRGGSGKGRWT